MNVHTHCDFLDLNSGTNRNVSAVFVDFDCMNTMVILCLNGSEQFDGTSPCLNEQKSMASNAHRPLLISNSTYFYVPVSELADWPWRV